MPTITQKNDAYLARTKKSLDVEKKYYKTKNEHKKEKEQQENSKNEERIAREASILYRTNTYSEFWIFNMGDRARKIVLSFHENKEMKDPLHVNVFDKSSRAMIKMKVSDILPNLKTDYESYHVNKFGQIRFHKDLYLASHIVLFLARYMDELQNSSDC